MLIDGHSGTKQISTIACRLGPLYFVPERCQRRYTPSFWFNSERPRRVRGADC
jgi:hypothetical protein